MNKNYEIKPYADLMGADLMGANLSGSNLRGADLMGANLSGSNLRGADLMGANLMGSNLRGADLRMTNLMRANLMGADLMRADLMGADLDYSVLPLWCGSLLANYDDKQLIQFAYHLVKAGLHSKNASSMAKRELNKLVGFVNRFHRVKECGKIEPFEGVE